MKTPEEMADEWVTAERVDKHHVEFTIETFLAGYQAAMEQNNAWTPFESFREGYQAAKEQASPTSEDPSLQEQVKAISQLQNDAQKKILALEARVEELGDDLLIAIEELLKLKEKGLPTRKPKK